MKKPTTLLEAAKKTYESRWFHKANGETYLEHVKEAAELMGGDVKLSDIDQAWVDKIRVIWGRKAKRSATANKKIAILSSVLNQAGISLYLPKLPVTVQAGARPFTDEEMERVDHWFRFTCPSNRSKATYAVLRDTGARGYEELSKITPDDIDWGAKELILRSKKGAQGDERERVVPLTEVAIRALSWIVNLECSPMFSAPMSAQFRKDFGEMRDELFPDDSQVKPYSLRHSFAMRLVKQGVKIHAIAKVMGHSSIQTTLNYLHSDSTDKEDILSALCTSKTPSN